MSIFNDTNDLSRCFSDRETIQRYPAAIRCLPYCVWKLTKDQKGRLTKVPFNPRNGLHAAVNNPTTFADLATALDAMAQNGYNGIGFLVSENIGCIDLDDSVSDDGNLSERADTVMRLLPGALAELSPSGHGIHLYFTVPEDFTFDPEDFYINNRSTGMEIYLPARTQRFMTITGNILREGHLQVTGEELQAFCEKFMRKKSPKPVRSRPPEGGSPLSDEDVLRLCCSGKGGQAFEKYYSGDWQKASDVNWSQSEADLSVCRRLAFFTRGDPAQMDRLFRSSGLIREKWDQRRGSSTYGQATIMKAIRGCSAFYEPKTALHQNTAPADFTQADPAAELDQYLSRKLTPEELLSKPFLHLALWAQNEDPLRYMRVKEKVPRKMGIRTFEAELKKLEKSRQTSSLQTVRTLRLSDCDPGGLILPAVWIVDNSGIRYRDLVAGRIQELPVSAEPVFISAKLVNMDDSSEKLEVTYRRNGKYISCTAPRSEFLNNRAIIKFADKGMPVHSGNALLLSRYLAELEEANNSTIAIRRCVDRAGWFGTEFYPFGMREDVQCHEDATGTTNLIEALYTSGREDVWLDLASQARKYPFARCMLAASFAAPLIHLLPHRNIFLHVWFESRGGKTAVAKLALAVWGNPDSLLGTYHATMYGLEQRCATLKHLPVVLDELQSLQEKRITVSDIVYNLGNGVGKTQGKPGSGIRRTGTWKTCILSTGEQPMSSDNSMDGINTRLMEINACPLMNQDGSVNEELGQRLHAEAIMNFGFAGKKLIRFLQEEIIADTSSADQISRRLQEDRKQIEDALKKAAPPRMQNSPYLANTSVLSLADFYASRAVFGEPAEQALEEAVAMGITILKNIETNRPMENIAAAWEFIIGWIASNTSQFIDHSSPAMPIRNTRDPILGIIEEDRIFVIAQKLNDALKEKGFNYQKCINGFKRAGYIDISQDAKGNERSQCTKRINGIQTRVYAFRRNRMADEAQNEFIITDEPFPEQRRVPGPQS